jgi:HEAT repeat protein
VSFESAVNDLKSRDKSARLRAVQLLKDAGYIEAAIPLAAAVTDDDDEVQLNAIAAELNIFLAEKVVTRRRVGLVIELRNSISAELVFAQGPLAIGPMAVPDEVLSALRKASRDAHPKIALEALYAFGVLAVEPAGAHRRMLLQEIVPELASKVGVTSLEYRYAAVRVMGRVFERRLEDDPIDPLIGDALVGVLNDNDRTIRAAAMRALGQMRYERAISALTDQFKYFDRGELAEAALDALARIANPASAPLFDAQLAAKQSGLKTAAIEALGRLGDPSRMPNLEAALAGERDERTVLAGKFAATMLSDTPIDSFLAALRKPKLADQARQYLVEIARGRPAALSQHAQDPDVQVRAGVADVLALAGNPSALSIVEPMQRDRDQQVVLAAQRAVARLTRIR